jgi:hypothetical protein
MKSKQSEPARALSALPKPKPEPRPGTAGQHALSTLSETLQDLSEVNLELLATFAKVLRRNTGCTTPAEEFISHVVLAYGFRDGQGRGMTPKDIETDVETFREDFEDLIDNHAFICERYGAQIHEGVA